jgi:hypothetical protein
MPSTVEPQGCADSDIVFGQGGPQVRYWFFRSAFVLFLWPARIPAQAPAPAAAVLEGEVVNAVTSAPIAGARVKLQADQEEPLYTRTDDRGRFRFTGLALRSYSYTLHAESPGFLKSGLSYVNPRVPQQPGRRTDGASGPDVRIPLTAYAAITGRITDPYGVPVSNCMVEVLRRQAIRPGHTASPRARPLPGGQAEVATTAQPTTNDKGEFRAAPLEPGTYYVVTGPRTGPVGWDPGYRNTYYPRAMDFASAQPLELAAGQQVRADIQILRRAGVRVSGRIVKPPGQEVPSEALLDTTIVLQPEGAYLTNPNRPFTHAKEDYQFSDVLPGKYTLMAATYDMASDPFGPDRKAVFGAMKKVEIGDSDRAGLDVALQPLRDIAGVVSFPEGCAAVPVRIAVQGLNPLGFRQVEALSGADGKFTLSGIVTGWFKLYITAKDGSYTHVASIRLGDRDVLNDGFEIPYAGSDALRVNVGCPESGRPR